jgi:hypothetical protein
VKKARNWRQHPEVSKIAKYVRLYRKFYQVDLQYPQQGGDEWSETQQYVWGTLVYTPEFKGDWAMLAEDGWRKHIGQFIATNPVVLIIPRVVGVGED